MDTALLTLLVVLAALVVLDVAALRFGADSRHTGDDRPDWW